LEIEFLAVEEEGKGRGVGKLLLKHMDEYAEQIGRKGIILTPRIHGEKNTIGFYEKNGYSIQDDRGFILRMQKVFS